MKQKMKSFSALPPFLSCLLLANFVIISPSSLTPANFPMREMFKQLIRDNPIVLLLDESNSDLELEIRESLVSVENAAGSVVFTFYFWWALLKPHVKPQLEAIKAPPLRWTFICLIEERRPKSQADRYLEELLLIGSGSMDRFILMSVDHQILKFIQSTQVQNFKNILAILADKNFIYQRRHIFEQPKRGGKALFTLVTNPDSVQWTPSITASLGGQHFRISGTNFPPYLDWVIDENGDEVLMGQNYRIFHEASIYHNYSYEFNSVQDWKPRGNRYLNGTWNGVFGDLLSGKADIASVSSQSLERNGLADFVGPFGSSHLVFVTSPPHKHLGKCSLLHSYPFKVWLCILSTFAIFVALFYESLQLSTKRQKKGRRVIKSNGYFCSKSLLLVWALSFEQTQNRPPRAIRCLMVMWMLFIVVIGTGYRSNLAASISIQQPEYKPTTFKELSEQRQYAINFDMTSVSAWTHFEETTNSILKNINMRSNKMHNATECVIKSFMDHDAVCIGWDFTLKVVEAKYLTIPQLKHPLTVSSSVWTAWYTFALHKNSVFTRAFQRIGESFFQSGFIGYWRTRLLALYRKSSIEWTTTQVNTKMYKKLERVRTSGVSETKPLKIENFPFVFSMLVMGLFASFLTFCLEVWIRRGDSSLTDWLFYHGQQLSQRYRRITVTESRVVPIDFVP